MDDRVLPTTIREIFESSASSEQKLAALMAAIVTLLNCDRCFLYVRDPKTRWGKAAFCHCRQANIPDVTTARWVKEPFNLERQDPMFAAALNCQPHIFIADVETAAHATLNREFEREQFGHRALVHAHLCREGQLWGVLQPAVFSKPHPWRDSDRQSIEAIAKQITPLVIEYVNRNLK